MTKTQLQKAYNRIVNAGFAEELTVLMQAAYDHADPAQLTVQDLFEQIHDVGFVILDSIHTIEVHDDGQGYALYIEEEGHPVIKNLDHQQLMRVLEQHTA